jgi:hypothetical protein
MYVLVRSIRSSYNNGSAGILHSVVRWISTAVSLQVAIVQCPTNHRMLKFKNSVILFCSADESSFTPYMRPTLCIVHSDGNIVCVPPYKHTASCSADLTRWPYDTHTCDLVLGSWTHTGENVNISLMEPSVRVLPLNDRVCCPLDSEDLLDLIIALQES